jgi:16S rRNA (cytosine967-C5)-methyltransferase
MGMSRYQPHPARRGRDQDEPPGQPARRLAVYVVDAVITRREAFDDAFEIGIGRLGYQGMPARDRGFARAVALATLRAKGRLDTLIARYLDKPLPADAGRTPAILTTAAAQLLLLDSPPHAVISQAVDIVRLDRTAARFDRLVNAILRRLAADGRTSLASLDSAALDVPGWLLGRWRQAYGEATAAAIARGCLVEPALDLSCRDAPAPWADRLGGIVLPTGTIRLPGGGRVEDLPGYADGAWWVQDAAAALPVRLLGAVAGKSVLDLCAAPGGKTMQLAAAGARVTAVDASAKRTQRLIANLARIDREAKVVTADVAAFVDAHPDSFDAVLLDAPCSATGTIRRHPDLMFTKPEADIARLADRQTALIRAAAKAVAPGGVLVYATCSLEPEEGPDIVRSFLAQHPDFTPQPAGERIPSHLQTADGALRTWPHQALGDSPLAAGMDGFYAACLLRRPAAGTSAA